MNYRIEFFSKALFGFALPFLLSGTVRATCLTLTVLLLLGGQTVSGTTITFDEFPADNDLGPLPSTRYAYLGVTFVGTRGSTFEGNSNGDSGRWSLEGTNGPFFSGYNGYNPDDFAMTLTSVGLMSGFSLDVSRANGSSSGVMFTLDGYLNGNLIETVTIPLNTINVWTNVSLTMDVDEVRWSSSGADRFRQYGIDNLNFNVPEPSRYRPYNFWIIGHRRMPEKIVVTLADN